MITLDLILNKIKKKKITSNFSLHTPILDKSDIQSISQAIKSTWISTKGKKTVVFENLLRKYFKTKYSVATNSGTSALFLSLKSLNVKIGDEIIIPNISFIAVPNAIIYNGATPHIVDTTENELNICPKKLESYLVKNTRIVNNKCINKKTGKRIAGIIAVHIFGHMCDMDRLKKICKKFKMFLIEDAAEAVGSLYKNKKPGFYSDIATVSFNGNKIITTGAGGAIITNNKNLYKKILSLSTLSNKTNSNYQNFIRLGYNLRMPSLNASLGISQLKKLNLQVLKKRRIYERYKKLFATLKKYFSLDGEMKNQKSNYWLQCIVINKDYEKYSLNIFKKIKKKKVSARMLWSPMNEIPYLKNCPRSNLRNSLEICKRVICIPSN